MEAVIEAQEREHNRRGRNASIIFAILVIIVMILPILTYPTPPPGQEGILVNLGLPDVGQGDDNAGPAAPAEPIPTPPQEEATPPPPQEAAPDPEPQTQEEVITTEDPEAIRLREQEAERKRQEAEAERQRQAELEAQRQRELEAEAERRRQEEAAQKTKDQIGGLFGDGGGKGNTGTAGNQGDPDGDPNSDNLSGVSDGVGSNVGGSLSGRGIVANPKISKATERGTVVIYLCVGANGSVTEARVQLRGTTAGASAQQQARANALKWKFSSGQLDKQCGTITYTFKLK